MRKVKLDSKAEKSADAFFDNEKLDENALLISVNSPKILELEKDDGSTNEHQSFRNLLKQIFIFLPGTFLLFFMSYGTAIIFLEIVVYRRKIQTLPDDFPIQFALIGLIILLGTWMTWFGLGNLKIRKHFAIPASLVVTGAVIGAIVKVTAGVFDLADKLLDNPGYFIYLFPLALIVPVLAKGIVDRKTEEASK